MSRSSRKTPRRNGAKNRSNRGARDTRAAEGLCRRRLVAGAAEQPEHGRAVPDADDATGERTQAADRRVPWVGDPSEASVGADDRAALERPEVEPVVVEQRPRLRVGERQHLEAVVEQEPVDDVGPHPAADRVGALEHERRAASRGERAGAGEPGQPGADDDHVVFLAHGRERTARGPLSRRARLREAGVDLRLAEREARGLELRRQHALPPSSISSPIWPNAAFDGEGRQREDVGRCRARPSAFTNSWFVTAPGSRDVDRAVERLLECEQVRGDDVVERDPAPPLAAAADAAADAELERQEQPLQCAAVPRQDDPLPEVHRPQAGGARGLGGGFPGADDVGEKAGARARSSRRRSSSPRTP